MGSSVEQCETGILVNKINLYEQFRNFSIFVCYYSNEICANMIRSEHKDDLPSPGSGEAIAVVLLRRESDRQ